MTKGICDFALSLSGATVRFLLVVSQAHEFELGDGVPSGQRRAFALASPVGFLDGCRP